ncbi:MAG: aminomethyl-transferring glycine dehydrogenase subunit GcvPA [Candidatus Polarisedimenticolaceae bacterium]|nr:aminomethyl-transferring glycine dehydrogenase subunit GcvPA [Candidatus Polarisedimenticolaceae bacterium]
MPFIPHTEEETQQMLETIGVPNIETLFDEIPKVLRCKTLQEIPEGLSEMEIGQLMTARAKQDGEATCFIGAGAYDHHIPAAVWQIASRGEFYTAYTPYQAEASQGTLQLLYEFQSMMTALTGMDVSNASLYDGASALAEAVLMAVRANRKSKSRRILIPRSLHPAYRKVVKALVGNQGLELVELPFNLESGRTDLSALDQYVGEDVAALVIPQPNFFGVLEEVDLLTDWAHNNQALAIGVVNPIASSILTPPGEWDENGADICCGDGQPLGAPLSSGGPYFGFLCCRDKLVRQMPGRIIGRTVDQEGSTGYTLTLQAREQHIRRSKATSNICTNQGLMATVATIYMTLLGAEGLERVALACHAKSQQLNEKLVAIKDVEPAFSGETFHETVLKLPASSREVLRALANHDLLGGYDLNSDYPELGNALLVCATEKRTDDEINRYARKLERILSGVDDVLCQLHPKD